MSDPTDELAQGANTSSNTGRLLAIGIVTFCNMLAALGVAYVNTSLRLLAIHPKGTVKEQAAMDGLWGSLPYILICALACFIALITLLSSPLLIVYLRGASLRYALLTVAAVRVNCAFWPVGCIQSSKYEYAARTHAFRAAAQRATPLLAALEQYKTVEGTYPQSLNLLVPKYLEVIPDTNLAAYPKFEYRYSLEDHGPDDFSLWINCPVGGINFDEFFYAPDGDEEDKPHTDSYERIDDWIYVHE